MLATEFMRCNPAKKISILKSDPNPEYVYAYISTKLGWDHGDLINKFKVTVQPLRSRIYISGEYSNIAKLFQMLSSYGVTFESIQISELRVDLCHLINTLK